MAYPIGETIMHHEVAWPAGTRWPVWCCDAGGRARKRLQTVPVRKMRVIYASFDARHPIESFDIICGAYKRVWSTWHAEQCGERSEEGWGI